VLRVDRSDELFDLAELFERQPLPAGRNVGVVSNSGGLGTLAADASLSRGLLFAAPERDVAGAAARRAATSHPCG